MLFSLTTQQLMERPDLWEAVHRLLGDAQAAGLLSKPVTVEFAA